MCYDTSSGTRLWIPVCREWGGIPGLGISRRINRVLSQRSPSDPLWHIPRLQELSISLSHQGSSRCRYSRRRRSQAVCVCWGCGTLTCAVTPSTRSTPRAKTFLGSCPPSEAQHGSGSKPGSDAATLHSWAILYGLWGSVKDKPEVEGGR